MGGRVVLLLVLTLLAVLVGGTHSRADTLEYSVKANYLVRFAAFVEWPADAFATARSPVSVCVAGRDPFDTALIRAANGQTAHGRPISVRGVTSEAQAAGCHILYLGEGAAAPRPGGYPSVLLVTDERVSAQRGAVHFVVADGRVRFHIDAVAASRARMSISSRLLGLALSVRSR